LPARCVFVLANRVRKIGQATLGGPVLLPSDLPLGARSVKDLHRRHLVSSSVCIGSSRLFAAREAGPAKLTERMARLARERECVQWAAYQLVARSDRLADLPIAGGAMQLATAPCRRLGLLFSSHGPSVSNVLFVAGRAEGRGTRPRNSY
jgi:hypothetical protein